MIKEEFQGSQPGFRGPFSLETSNPASFNISILSLMAIVCGIGIVSAFAYTSQKYPLAPVSLPTPYLQTLASSPTFVLEVYSHPHRIQILKIMRPALSSAKSRLSAPLSESSESHQQTFSPTISVQVTEYKEDLIVINESQENISIFILPMVK